MAVHNCMSCFCPHCVLMLAIQQHSPSGLSSQYSSSAQSSRSVTEKGSKSASRKLLGNAGSMRDDSALTHDYKGRPRMASSQHGMVAADQGDCSAMGMQKAMGARCVCVTVCLSACLPDCLAACWPIVMSIRLSACLSVCLSV